MFGNNETLEVEPAIADARARGLIVPDPMPPDTIFLRAVSMGLPIIRTSVDHGTAFDIADTGKASEESLLAAIDVAVQMVNAQTL